MTELNIIAGGAILLLCVIIIGIRVYQKYRANGSITIDEVIEDYGDKIIMILQDTIQILKMDMANYTSQEEYETAVISATIDCIKENSVSFGIPSEIVNLLDTESLTEIVKRIFNNNKVLAFSILSSNEVTTNKKILDNEVVFALGEAEGGEEDTTDPTIEAKDE